MFRSQLEIKSNNASLISEMSDFLIPSGLVLDRVRHFQPTPIFLLSTDTDTIPIRFKSGRRAARLTDQRLQTPPPQLITVAAARTGCSAAADAFDLLWTVKHSNYQ